MPELPDLQVFRKNIEKKLAGKKLKHLEIFNSQKVNVAETELKKLLVGKKLKSITRDGKELFFHFDKDQVLSFHLMLNGDFHFYHETNLFKNKIIELLFDDDNGLLLTDWRKNAIVKLNPEIPSTPDAYSEKFNLEYLSAGLKKYDSKRIKDLLIDQKFVRGIGNAYIDEILWEAKIHPASKSGKIPSKVVKKLYKSIYEVMENAEKEILKRDPDIIKGEIRDFLKVHNSKLTHSPTGGTIIKDDSGSRTTYYTPEQVLYD